MPVAQDPRTAPLDVLANCSLVPLGLIVNAPGQPRQSLPDIEPLARNIAQYGLLQPVCLRRVAGRYEIVSGHRRVGAFRWLQEHQPAPEWLSIQSFVLRVDDETAALSMVSAQTHVEPWSAGEEAAALGWLRDSGLTLAQMAALLNRTDGWVSKRIRVHRDPVLAPFVLTDQLPVSTAEELLVVREPAERCALAEQAVDERWSARRLKAVVRDQVARKHRQPRQLESQPDVSDQVAALQRCAAALRRALTGIAARDLPPSVLEELDTVRVRLNEVLTIAEVRAA